MVTLVAVLHLLFCAGLIGFVLLQDPKGGGTAGVFSGAGANQLFGTTGAANLLTKITSWCAICFGITCLLLSILSKSNSGSVIDATSALSPVKPAGSTSTNMPPGHNVNAAPSSNPTTGTPSAPVKAPEKSEKK